MNINVTYKGGKTIKLSHKITLPCISEIWTRIAYSWWFEAPKTVAQYKGGQQKLY
jgi:hypothetical protein